MKKLLLVGLAVVLVTVAAAGIASGGAWFTTQADVGTGSVSSGSVDLQVEGEIDAVQNIEPGADFVPAGWFCVENVGDYNMKWRGWLTDVTDPGLGQFLNVKVTINPTDHPGNYGPPDKVLIPNESIQSLNIGALQGENSYIVVNDPVWAFAPGHKVCYGLEVKAVPETPNWVQNQTYSAKLVLQGTQYIHRDGWGEK